MDWKPAIEDEVAALKRIVALLCALADLAERAAGRSGAVRALVLWLLGHAAVAARKLVAGQVEPSPISTSVVPVGRSPADATRLAESLRALARQIDQRSRLAFAAGRARLAEPAEPAFLCRGPATLDVLKAVSALTALPRQAPHPAPNTS